jgi:hypothetical protein
MKWLLLAKLLHVRFCVCVCVCACVCVCLLALIHPGSLGRKRAADKPHAATSDNEEGWSTVDEES